MLNRLLTLSIFLMMLTSCSNLSPNKQTNVYDPKEIEIGDQINNFVLTKIYVIPATSNYPMDTVSAMFEGIETITGDLQLIKADGEFYKMIY